jgi:ankyrin repeat protein
MRKRRMRAAIRRILKFWTMLALLVGLGWFVTQKVHPELLRNDLLTAVYAADSSKAQRALAQGADPNVMTSDGYTALMIASANGRLDLISALVAKGANVNAQDNYGKTALMCACEEQFAVPPRERRTEVVRALLKAGADPNRRDKVGTTALMISAECGQTEIIRLLLSAGADPDAQNAAGASCLQFARLDHPRLDGSKDKAAVLELLTEAREKE